MQLMCCDQLHILKNSIGIEWVYFKQLKLKLPKKKNKRGRNRFVKQPEHATATQGINFMLSHPYNLEEIWSYENINHVRICLESLLNELCLSVLQVNAPAQSQQPLTCAFPPTLTLVPPRGPKLRTLAQGSSLSLCSRSAPFSWQNHRQGKSYKTSSQYIFHY